MSPNTDEPLSYANDIKQLFRPKDKEAMDDVFDLWSYDDVTRHADAIPSELRAGTMPCDGAWPTDQTDTFQRWIDTGKAP